MRFYRFEIAPDKTANATVGLFTSFGDIDTIETDNQLFDDSFRHLPSPALHHIPDDAQFWFTPLGLKRFAQGLKQAEAMLRNQDYQLIMLTLDIDPEPDDVSYYDRFQVALPKRHNNQAAKTTASSKILKQLM